MAMLPRGNRRLGRPPAATANKTRQRIIQSARWVFSERGYDGATFQSIAARADVTRPTINHYFASKQLLYREALDATNESVLVAAINQAERETTMTARLTTLISAVLTTNLTYPAGVALLVTGVLESQRHPEWNNAGNDSVRISREFLKRMINEAIERREVVADVDVSVMIDTLLVMLCGVGLYAGCTQSYQEILAVIDVLRPFLEGGRWGPDREHDRRAAPHVALPSDT
jgi:AcrR family transcriptional regulator